MLAFQARPRRFAGDRSERSSRALLHSNRHGEGGYEFVRGAIIPLPPQHGGADVGHRQGKEQKPAPLFLRGQRAAGERRSEDLFDERLVDLRALLFPRLEVGGERKTIAGVRGKRAVRIRRREGIVKGRERAWREGRKRRIEG